MNNESIDLQNKWHYLFNMGGSMDYEKFCGECKQWYVGDDCPCIDDGIAENEADLRNDDRREDDA